MRDINDEIRAGLKSEAVHNTDRGVNTGHVDKGGDTGIADALTVEVIASGFFPLCSLFSLGWDVHEVLPISPGEFAFGDRISFPLPDLLHEFVCAAYFIKGDAVDSAF